MKTEKNKAMREKKKEVGEMICSGCDSLDNMSGDQPAPFPVGSIHEVFVKAFPKASA
jgi:hypothetical protein